MTFTELWNEAYNTFTDGSRSEGAAYSDMQAFLPDAVKNGMISMGDKCRLAADVMETAGL